MKKLLSILLAAILLLSCFAALAEDNSADTVFLEEFGITLDLAAIKGACANSITLENDGVLMHDPYVALSLVAYYAIPQELLDQIIGDYSQASEEDRQAYTQMLRAVSTVPAYIIVSDAPDQAAMMDALGLQAEDGMEVIEAATRDSWHYYVVKMPVYVYDAEGNPVEGAFIQFCDDVTCAFQPTDANGLAEFRVDVEKVYEVHVIQAPEGFRQDERSYETLDSYSDVNIFLEKAE